MRSRMPCKKTMTNNNNNKQVQVPSPVGPHADGQERAGLRRRRHCLQLRCRGAAARQLRRAARAGLLEQQALHGQPGGAGGGARCRRRGARAVGPLVALRRVARGGGLGEEARGLWGVVAE
jgi:hypothetical protein